jgi:hypothetical protein
MKPEKKGGLSDFPCLVAGSCLDLIMDSRMCSPSHPVIFVIETTPSIRRLHKLHLPTPHRPTSLNEMISLGLLFVLFNDAFSVSRLYSAFHSFTFVYCITTLYQLLRLYMFKQDMEGRIKGKAVPVTGRGGP